MAPFDRTNSQPCGDRSQSGTTLIELVITVLIASVLFLGVGILIVQNVQRSQETGDRLDLETDFLRFEYALRSAFAAAVDVRLRPGAGATVRLDPTYNTPAVPPNPNDPVGWVRPYNFDGNVAPTPNRFRGAIEIEPLAAFPREASRSGAIPSGITPPYPPESMSYFAGTALYFIPPSRVSGEHKSGVLILATSSLQHDVTTVSERRVSPGYGDAFLGNVTDVSVNIPSWVDVNYGGAPQRMVQHVEIRITVRSFGNRDVGQTRCFVPQRIGAPPTDPNPCGPSMAAPGETLAPYRDETRSFRITLRNNDLGESQAEPAFRRVRERAFGRIYFFPMVGPLMGGG